MLTEGNPHHEKTPWPFGFFSDSLSGDKKKWGVGEPLVCLQAREEGGEETEGEINGREKNEKTRHEGEKGGNGIENLDRGGLGT